MKKEKLFDVFPPIADKEWKDKIIADLKGANFDNKLVWKTDEAINVQPYYRSADFTSLSHTDILPGNFPFIRGNHVKGNKWLIRQNIKVKDIATANKKAIDIIMNGVNSICFILSDDIDPDLLNLERLCKNISSDKVELNFSTKNPLLAVKTIDALIEKDTRDHNKFKGSVEYDPIGDFCIAGKFKSSQEDDLSLLLDMYNASKHIKGLQFIVVNAGIFNNAGADIASEISYALSMGAEYLTYLTEKGFKIDDVAGKIRFHFAVGSDYFMEIAKFRAIKYLWAKIISAYGLSNDINGTTHIHCTNSKWNKTIYDPYVNILRATTEAMSAILGGVNSLTILPFNSVYENSTEFSERIARNQQLILKGEAYLDKVADVSAGSYYIEELTNKLIHKSWNKFLELDEKGGFIEAFKKGTIQDVLREESEMKHLSIATRNRSILGINQFPNIEERLSANFDFPITKIKHDTNVEPINIYRGANKLEELRFKTDKYADTHKRPTAWMFTYGNLAMRKSRAQFAENFFGCAGYEIIDNPGFTSIDEGISVAKIDKPNIIVICSSDDDYNEIAEPIFNALNKTSIIVIAGYPKEILDKLQDIGITNYIHMRSNMLKELTRYNDLMKIS
ncbi:MAG: methylmalonyl-CoA mutase small subunit [Lentimicrobiaceae bacterium]|nr:methylmalonyl-CoA mutase small subunit [Lentimicrobiaceae bacterium]